MQCFPFSPLSPSHSSYYFYIPPEQEGKGEKKRKGEQEKDRERQGESESRNKGEKEKKQVKRRERGYERIHKKGKYREKRRKGKAKRRKRVLVNSFSFVFPFFSLSVSLFHCFSLLKITGEKAAARWARAAEARLEVALVSAGECVELVLSEKLNEMSQTDDLLYLYTMNAGTEIKLYLAIGAKDSYRLKPQTAV